MNFKIQKINNSGFLASLWGKLKGWFGPFGAWFLVFILLVGSVAGASVLTIQALDSGPGRTLLPQMSALKTDSFGRTNIVLLGVAGKTEEGGNLSDSIMIASIDTVNPSVSLLSLPRDLFVSSEIGDRKINEIYAAARYKNKKNDLKGLQVVEDAIADFAGVEIHYGAVINFQIFQDVINALGGIEMYITNDIVDPFYPDEDFGYQTFVIRKGLQKLDGDTALKYARSRKTSSDYDRAQRQQDLLLAIREKAADMNLFGAPNQLRSLYNLYHENVSTDMNFIEIAALAKVGAGINYDRVISNVLNDDPNQKGGLLYTPAKEFYGGQFVLLPESLEDTQIFMNLTLSEPHILAEKTQVRILNGSKITGEAGKATRRLRRLGFHVIEVGNYETDKPVFRTFARTYGNVSQHKQTIELLDTLFDFLKIDEVSELETDPDNLIDFEIVLGTN